MKRILVISPAPTHPQNAGNRSRIFKLLCELQNLGFEIHFLYTGNECNAGHVIGKPDYTGMRNKWDRFIYIPNMPARILAVLPFNFFEIDNRLLTNLIKPTHFFQLLHLSGNFLNALPKLIYRAKILAKIAIRTPHRLPAVLGQKLSPGFYASLRSHYWRIRKQTPPATTPAFPPDQQNFAIDDWYNNGLDKHIRALNEKYNYSSVMVEYVFMSSALKLFSKETLKVIDTHDIFTDRAQRYHVSGIEDHFFSTTRNEEAKGLNRSDVVIAIQDQEAKHFTEISNAPTAIIGHPVELEPIQPRVEERNNILYIGAANIANIQGLGIFIKDIMPKVIEAIPSAKLLLAGAICNHFVAEKHIVKLGFVENLKDAYKEADIVINPVFVGTGLKIKNIEALGYAKPLVTTDHGGEGMNDHQGAFILASDNTEFADKIVELLTNSCFYDTMCKNAYESAKNYNYQIQRKLQLVFED